MPRMIALYLALLCIACLAACEDEATSPDIPFDPSVIAPPSLQAPGFGEIVAQPSTFSWRPDSIFEGYRLQIALHITYDAPLVDTIVFGVSSIETTDLPHNTMLFWRVGGMIREEIRWSATRECVAQLYGEPPILIAPDDAALTTLPVVLTWEDHPKTTEFVVHLSPEPDFTDTILDTTVSDQHAVSVNGLVGGIDYYWSVGAVIEDSVFWSEVRSFSCDVPPPEGYRSCTMLISGITYVKEERTIWPGDTTRDTTTSTYTDHQYTFERVRSKDHFIHSSKDASWRIEVEWSTVATISSFTYRNSYYYRNTYPDGTHLETRWDNVIEALVPWAGSGGVYSLQGQEAISRQLSFSYTGYSYDHARYEKNTRLLEVIIAPDAEVRLTFEE